MYTAKIPVIRGIFQWHNQCGVRVVHDGKDALVYERKFKSEYLERQIYERSLKSESSILKPGETYQELKQTLIKANFISS